MPLDHYVTPGRSELRVSPFALGRARCGTASCPAGTGAVRRSPTRPGRPTSRPRCTARRGPCSSSRVPPSTARPPPVYPPLLASDVRY